MLRAVVFDFDGVLANTEPLHLQAWQQVLAEEGTTLTTAEYYERYLGYDDQAMLRAVAADAGREWTSERIGELVARKGRRFDATLGEAPLFAGAEQTVRQLARLIPLAVASGALRGEIEAVLARTGLRACFQAIVAAGEVPRGKPAPDPYARAVALLAPCLSGEPAGRSGADGVVAVEDSHWGIESAQAAGLRCVAVAHTYPAGQLRAADLVVERVGDLTVDLLRELWEDRSPAR